MAGTKKSKSSAKSKSSGKKESKIKETRRSGQQDDASREVLAQLTPQERVAAVKPLWQTLSHDERVKLLTISTSELHEYAAQLTAKQRKQAALDAAAQDGVDESAVPTVNLEPTLTDTLELGVGRLKEKTTWKVWQWPGDEEPTEFYDADSFRQHVEEHHISDELRKLLPKDEGKPVEKPAEAALRQRMTELLQRIHQNTRQLQDEMTFGRRLPRGQRTTSDALHNAVRDTNIDLITHMLEALEREHEFLYHAVLFPVTSFVCELLPEGMRESSRTELFFEDLEKLPPEEVARICEWITEKVDSFSAKLKPEAKDVEEEEEEEEGIGDVDLFQLMPDHRDLTVNAKWLQHLQERLLGEDGHPRKVSEGEDDAKLGLVLEWVYGTIVSTAEKARDGAKRSLGVRPPTALAAHEQLLAALADQQNWEMRSRQAKELLNEMLRSRKEAAELAKKYDTRPVPMRPAATVTGSLLRAAEELPTPEELPGSVIVAMLSREVLLTKAKLHALCYEHIMGERKLRSLKAQLRQGEPEFDRLKRELEEVKSAPRGLEGTFRTAAEMERHRAQMADAAIEEQLEVQTAFREHGARLQGIYDKRQRTELEMAKREQEMKQLQGWKTTVATLIERFEELMRQLPPEVPPPPAVAPPGDDSDAHNSTEGAGEVGGEGPDSAVEEGAAAPAAGDEVEEVDGGNAQSARALLNQASQMSQAGVALAKLRAHFHKDVRRQLYTDDDDRQFFDWVQRELRAVEKRLDDGRAALQHLEMQLINVACDDPGALIGSQLALPLLQERLDARARDYAALKAAEAEEQIIKMEEEKAERDRAERERKAKAKQRLKDRARSEREKLAAEKQAREAESKAKQQEEVVALQLQQEAARVRRLEELEALRVAEEETLEARRRELLSEENGYWRQRMAASEAEEVAPAIDEAALQSALKGDVAEECSAAQGAMNGDARDGLGDNVDTLRRNTAGTPLRPRLERPRQPRVDSDTDSPHAASGANGHVPRRDRRVHPPVDGRQGDAARPRRSDGERYVLQRPRSQAGSHGDHATPAEPRLAAADAKAVPAANGVGSTASLAPAPAAPPLERVQPVQEHAAPSQQPAEAAPARLAVPQPPTPVQLPAGSPPTAAAGTVGQPAASTRSVPAGGSPATPALLPAVMPVGVSPSRPPASANAVPLPVQPQLPVVRPIPMAPHTMGPGHPGPHMRPEMPMHAPQAGALHMPPPPPPQMLQPPARPGMPSLPMPQQPLLQPPVTPSPRMALPVATMQAAQSDASGKGDMGPMPDNGGPASSHPNASMQPSMLHSGGPMQPMMLPSSSHYAGALHYPPMSVPGHMAGPPHMPPANGHAGPSGMPVMVYPPNAAMMGQVQGQGMAGHYMYHPYMMPMPVPGMIGSPGQHGPGMGAANGMPGGKHGGGPYMHPAAQQPSRSSMLRAGAQPFVPSTLRASGAQQPRQQQPRAPRPQPPPQRASMSAAAQSDVRARAPAPAEPPHQSPTAGPTEGAPPGPGPRSHSAAAPAAAAPSAAAMPAVLPAAARPAASAAMPAAAEVTNSTELAAEDAQQTGVLDRASPAEAPSSAALPLGASQHQPPGAAGAHESSGSSPSPQQGTGYGGRSQRPQHAAQQQRWSAVAASRDKSVAAQPPAGGHQGRTGGCGRRLESEGRSGELLPQVKQLLRPLGAPPADAPTKAPANPTASNASDASVATTATLANGVAAAAADGTPPAPAASETALASSADSGARGGTRKRTLRKAGGLLLEGLEEDVKRLKLVRGLINDSGQYNCFLNVVIQSLWHLRCFRSFMLRAPVAEYERRGGTVEDVRVMQALANIFHAFANAPTDVEVEEVVGAEKGAVAAELAAASARGSGWAVSPTELREALSSKDQGRMAQQFELGDMHDAAEVLGEVLTCLHRAELGATAQGHDPQLPVRVRLPTPQAAPSSAGAVASEDGVVPVSATNGTAGREAEDGGGAAAAKLRPRSHVQELFGLEVQVPVPNDDDAEATDGFARKGRSSSGWRTANRSGGRSNAAASGSAGRGRRDGAGPPEVLQYTKYFHYVPAQGLRIAAELLAGRHASFEEILREAEMVDSGGQARRGSGAGHADKAITLLRRSQVFTLSVVWESPQVAREAISGTMRGVRTVLDVGGVFKGVPPGRKFHLKAMVCYFGHHYNSYALSEEVDQWLLFDDTTITLVGSWRDVCHNIAAERHQPSVLFYEADD